MSKKVLITLSILVFILIGTYLAKDYFSNRIDTYEADLKLGENQMQLYKFLSLHDREIVFIDIIFDKEQNDEFNSSIGISPDISMNSLFSSIDKDIKSIFKTREDGKREFVYDVLTKNLKGLFIPYIQNIDENKTIINLISITPNEAKKIK